jgi:hypothetical protein
MEYSPLAGPFVVPGSGCTRVSLGSTNTNYKYRLFSSTTGHGVPFKILMGNLLIVACLVLNRKLKTIKAVIYSLNNSNLFKNSVKVPKILNSKKTCYT